MRLFYALSFTDQSLVTLAGMQHDLLSTLESGRPTRTELLHLTLLFLGDVDTTEFPILTASLQGLSSTLNSLTVTDLCFVKRPRSSMVWATVAEQRQLITLREDLRLRLLAKGFFTPEERFSGHITLIRDAQGKIKNSARPRSLSVNSITLFHSHSQRGILTHTPLCSMPL
jgi:2'-5' RNA ligase